MTDIETRLREALSARADLVAPESLARQAPLPEPEAPWWRRPGPALLAAAAVLLVCVPAGVLLATSGDGPEPDPAPAVSTTHSSTPTPSDGTTSRPDGPPTEWGTAPQAPAGATVEADVDGDGLADRISLAPADQLQVDTAGGTLTAGVPGAQLTLGGAVTIAGSPTPVITVQATEGAAGTTYVDWHLFVVRDGALVELKPPSRNPYLGNQLSDLTEDEGGRDAWETWQTTSDGGSGEIYTMGYLDNGTTVPDGAYPDAGDLLFHAGFYRWVVDGDGVSSQRIGEACVVPPSTKVYDCP